MKSFSIGDSVSENGLIIIDNDCDFASRISSVFVGNYLCKVARTGEEGLDLFSRLSVGNRLFVLCGSNLPDMSACDVCMLIKKEEPQTFVILLFQNNDLEERMKGLTAGADNCLSKKILDEELELLVSNIFHTLSSTRDAFDRKLPDTNGDDIFSALEVEVRSAIELYYQLSPEQREFEECSSRSVAEHLGVSLRTFQRIMKSETGYTFKQLKLIVRLEKAQQLLADGRSVNEVTDLLSFSSPAHLSSAFKSEFGVRPSKYRRTIEVG